MLLQLSVEWQVWLSLMTTLRDVFLCHEFVLELLGSIQISPCPTCKVKHLLRLRTVSRQLLTIVDYTMCCMLQNGWPYRQTQQSLKILGDCLLFRDSIVAKILRKHCMNRFDSESTGPGNSLAATNRTTRAMSDEVEIQEIHCLICRAPLKRLMAPPVVGYFFLRSCLTCLTIPVSKPYKTIPRRAMRYLGVARICVRGARYELLHRGSSFDGVRALAQLFRHILTFL